MMLIFCCLILLLLLFLLSSLNVMCDVYQCQRPWDERSITCVLRPGFENVVCPLSPGFLLTNVLSRSALWPSQFKTFVKNIEKNTPTACYSYAGSLLSLLTPAPMNYVCVTLTLQREQSKQESIAQAYVPEYMKSVQQIPAGFVICTIPFDKFSSLETLPYYLLSLILFSRAALLAW